MFGMKKKTPEEPLVVTYEEVNGSVNIVLVGRLDSVTASNFQAEAVSKCSGKSATLDMAEVAYVSSAGLRAILALDKATGPDNKLNIVNASGAVKDVLDMSGFSDFI